MTRLISAVPVLPVLDLRQALAFYTKLGFHTVMTRDDNAAIERDKVQIRLWACIDHHLSENSSCRLEVEGLDAFAKTLEGEGLVDPGTTAQPKPWGTREILVSDPSGNAIIFFERVR